MAIVPAEPVEVRIFVENNRLKDRFGLTAVEIMDRNQQLVRLVTYIELGTDEIQMIPKEVVAPWLQGVRLVGLTSHYASTKFKHGMHFHKEGWLKKVETDRIAVIKMENDEMIKVTGSCRQNEKRGFKGRRVDIYEPRLR